MYSHKYLFFFILVQIIFSSLFAQNKVLVHHIANNPELPSNLMKAVIQDDEGYIWIASDEGLIRYDGEEFSIFNDHFESLYLKKLYHYQGSILILSDDGIHLLSKINNRHIIQPFLDGFDEQTDSTTFYPKAIYTDHYNNLWISEPNSILKKYGSQLKRYNLPDKFRTTSYVRSFILSEDNNGTLIAVSQSGYILYYNPEEDKFIEIPFSPQFQTSFEALFVSQNTGLIAGGNAGLFRINIEKDYKSARISRLSNLRNVSSIIMDFDNHYYVGTWTNGLYKFNNFDSNPQYVSDVKFDVVNSLSISRDGIIWLSSDQGLAYLRETFFNQLNFPSSTKFIEDVIKSNENEILTTEGYHVFMAVETDSGMSSATLFTSNQSLIRSLSGNSRNLWIGYGDGFLINYKNNKQKRIDLISKESGHLIITDLLLDKYNQLWAAQEIHRGIIRINEDFQQIYYDSLKGLNSNVNIVKQNIKGEIFCGGTGPDSYLFKYNRESDSFENLSIPLPFQIENSFQVNDLDFDSHGNIWIATDYGLLKYSGNSIIRIDNAYLFENSNIKSVAVDTNNKIWLGLEYGIALCDTSGQLMVFDELCGLSNLTTTPGTAVIDSENRLWIGTAHGLSYLQNNVNKNIKTPKPIIRQMVSNDISYNANLLNELQYDSPLFIRFNSLSYPSDRILYRYKINQITDGWTVPDYSNRIHIPSLDPGEYKIEIIARQTGYTWSDTAGLSFVVNKPFYLTNFAFVLYFAAVIILIVFVILFNKEKRARRKLSDQINHFFNGSTDILCIINLEDQLLQINPFGTKMFDNSPNKPDAKLFQDLFEKEEKDNITSLLKNIKETKTADSFISKIYNDTGKEHYYQWKISASSKFDLLYAIGRDISDIKYLEEELEMNILHLETNNRILDNKSHELSELNKKLKESENSLIALNADKDKFFSIISHDLKSPFTALLGATELLVSDLDSYTKDEIEESVEMIYTASKNVFRLLEDILEWSRMQMGRMEIAPERIQLSEVFKISIDLNKSAAYSKDISIILNVPDDIIAFADMKTVNALMRNLLSNAIKFTENGGNVEITSHRIDDKIEVSVIDSGIGISEKDIANMFRIDIHHTTKGTNNESGTGIGLILCKEFAERNGGTIQVESEIGKGSKFIFTLPAART